MSVDRWKNILYAVAVGVLCAMNFSFFAGLVASLLVVVAVNIGGVLLGDDE